MILSSDGLVYGLCALMCGSVAALDGYGQFGNLEREAQYLWSVEGELPRISRESGRGAAVAST